MRRGRRALSGSSSFVPSWSVQVVGVLGTPLEAYPSPPVLEGVGGRRLEVLLHDRQVAPIIELDDVPGEHADVDDVPDPPGLAGPVPIETHLDFFRPHGE